MGAAPAPAFGVIDDARARQWRRRRRLAVMLAVVAALATVAVRLSSHGGRAAATAGLAARPQRPNATAHLARAAVCFDPKTKRVIHGWPCVPATPATLLAPGIVRAVSLTAPHDDPWILSLQRIRAQGVKLLCVQATPISPPQCMAYPGQPNTTPYLGGDAPLGANPPVQLTLGNEGTCKPPAYAFVSGLVMRPGLSIWLTSPTGTSRIRFVPVDPRFEIPGGVFAAIVTHGPVTLTARDAAGRTVYTTLVTSLGDRPSYCNDLNGGYLLQSWAHDKAMLQPHLIEDPFGPFVLVKQ